MAERRINSISNSYLYVACYVFEDGLSRRMVKIVNTLYCPSGKLIHMNKPPYYITDPWHFLDENGNLPYDLPGPAKKLSLFLGQIIRECSAQPAGTTYVTSLKCRRRPARKPCPGKILTWRNSENDSIKWECSQCGTGGEIHNWRRCPWDTSGKELN